MASIAIPLLLASSAAIGSAFWLSGPPKPAVTDTTDSLPETPEFIPDTDPEPVPEPESMPETEPVPEPESMPETEPVPEPTAEAEAEQAGGGILDAPPGMPSWVPGEVPKQTASIPQLSFGFWKPSESGSLQKGLLAEREYKTAGIKLDEIQTKYDAIMVPSVGLTAQKTAIDNYNTANKALNTAIQAYITYSEGNNVEPDITVLEPGATGTPPPTTNEPPVTGTQGATGTPPPTTGTIKKVDKTLEKLKQDISVKRKAVEDARKAIPKSKMMEAKMAEALGKIRVDLATTKLDAYKKIYNSHAKVQTKDEYTNQKLEYWKTTDEGSNRPNEKDDAYNARVKKQKSTFLQEANPPQQIDTTQLAQDLYNIQRVDEEVLEYQSDHEIAKEAVKKLNDKIAELTPLLNKAKADYKQKKEEYDIAMTEVRTSMEKKKAENVPAKDINQRRQELIKRTKVYLDAKKKYEDFITDEYLPAKSEIRDSEGMRNKRKDLQENIDKARENKEIAERNLYSETASPFTDGTTDTVQSTGAKDVPTTEIQPIRHTSVLPERVQQEPPQSSPSCDFRVGDFIRHNITPPEYGTISDIHNGENSVKCENADITLINGSIVKNVPLSEITKITPSEYSNRIKNSLKLNQTVIDNKKLEYKQKIIDAINGYKNIKKNIPLNISSDRQARVYETDKLFDKALQDAKYNNIGVPPFTYVDGHISNMISLTESLKILIPNINANTPPEDISQEPQSNLPKISTQEKVNTIFNNFKNLKKISDKQRMRLLDIIEYRKALKKRRQPVFQLDYNNIMKLDEDLRQLRLRDAKRNGIPVPIVEPLTEEEAKKMTMTDDELNKIELLYTQGNDSRPQDSVTSTTTTVGNQDMIEPEQVTTTTAIPTSEPEPVTTTTLPEQVTTTTAIPTSEPEPVTTTTLPEEVQTTTPTTTLPEPVTTTTLPEEVQTTTPTTTLPEPVTTTTLPEEVQTTTPTTTLPEPEPTQSVPADPVIIAPFNLPATTKPQPATWANGVKCKFQPDDIINVEGNRQKFMKDNNLTSDIGTVQQVTATDKQNTCTQLEVDFDKGNKQVILPPSKLHKNKQQTTIRNKETNQAGGSHSTLRHSRRKSRKTWRV